MSYYPSRKATAASQVVKLYLLGLGFSRCYRCGYAEFSSALQFHHVDPATKRNTVSHAIARFGNSMDLEWWRLLASEVNKCIILCANCHQAWHAQEWEIVDALPLYVQVHEIPTDLWKILRMDSVTYGR